MSSRDNKFIRQHSEPATNIPKLEHDVPDTRTSECNSLDGKRIYVRFYVNNQPEDFFKRSFKYTYTILEIRSKLAKIIDIPAENLILSKDGVIIPDEMRLSELLEGDCFEDIEIDIATKDESYIDVDLLNEKFNESISVILQDEQPKKSIPPNISCKFHVVNQNHCFTKSFTSSTTVGSVKQDLSAMLVVEDDVLLLVKNKAVLQESAFLSELEMDDFGNLEIELFTKDGRKLKFDTVYKDVPTSDILTVTVPIGPKNFVYINVEVIDSRIVKPYLGGYRNNTTGLDYHHAFSQTQQRREKLPPEMKNNRDTQTVTSRAQSLDTNTSRATQMRSPGVYIPNLSDVIICAKPYETYAQMVIRLKHSERATIIQRAWRAYCYRKAVFKWLKQCSQRVQDLKNEELAEKRAYELRLQREIISKTFPRTREDFDQLYAMVDRWRNAEIARISKLHTKGPKVAEFCLLLDKEIQLLRSIEKFRVELKEDFRKTKEKNLLEEMSKPVEWQNSKGEIISMDTIEAQQARKLKELYFSFNRDDLSVEARMELLMNLKFTLKHFKSPLTNQLISLLDRECDLRIRNIPAKELDVLKKRIQTMLFQLIKSPEFNSGGIRRTEKEKLDKMKEQRLYHCNQCQRVKIYSEFPLHSRSKDMLVCTSCSWGNAADQNWVDMTPYKFMLRAIRREERRNKCSSSLAFILQEKDIYFIVEKIWHAHSALSENSNITDLRLSRWLVNEDWSPWNCILLTLKEMKSHIKLQEPLKVYDPDLVDKISTKHLLAKAHFKQLTSAEDHNEKISSSENK